MSKKRVFSCMKRANKVSLTKQTFLNVIYLRVVFNPLSLDGEFEGHFLVSRCFNVI